MRSTSRGFIALISALIISAVMLLIITGNSLSGFYTRTNALLMEYKERSATIAQACVDQTLLALALDPIYAGSATTTVSGSPNGACRTGPVTLAGTAPNQTYSFTVRSYYQDAYTSYAVIARKSDLSITSFIEVPKFGN